MGPALLHGLRVVNGEGQPGGQRQHREAHDHPVVIVAMEGCGGGVELPCAAVDGDGPALAFQHAAAGPQLGFHGRDAVALLDAEALGVADGGGPLAEQAQHHQHGAKVGTVGKVDVGAAQGSFPEPDALIGDGQLCPAAAQDAEDGRIPL